MTPVAPNAAATRPFSSSSSTSFLFRRPKSAGLDELQKEILEATSNGRLDLVGKLYPTLVAAHKKRSSSSSSSSSARESGITRNTMSALLKFVATTSRFPLLLRIFNDFPLLGHDYHLRDHHLLIQGMLRAGKASKALEYVTGLQSTHGVRPRVSEWNLVVGGYRKARDFDGMRRVMERMEEAGTPPDLVTYNTFLAGLFDLGLVGELRRTIKEMERRGIEPDVKTDTTLLSAFLAADELASAREVRARLASKLDKQVNLSDTVLVDALLRFEAVDKGFGAAKRLARQFNRKGLLLDSWTLNTLAVEGSYDLQTSEDAVMMLEDLEEVTGVNADRRSWTIALQGVLGGPGGVEEGLKVHQEARDRSVQPDAIMIQPLLVALLVPSPTPDSFASAKALYEDLAQASRAYDTGPDLSTYITLLRACADPEHPDLDYSRSLINDMRERGIRVDGASATWHIVALMRAASNFEEAFGAYDQIRALDPTVLDQASYNTILGAFTSLSFASDPHADPTQFIMEFLSDMRHSSPPQPPTNATYSQLLIYYSRSTIASARSIAHLHSLIKLDVNLDPDTALFNSLMSAYARVGAFAAAYRIYDTMLANTNSSTPIDNRSVSIIIDACGWEGTAPALKRLDNIWEGLSEGKAKGIRVRNRKHWDSYVEALCRLGRFDRAEQAVFEEMGEKGEPAPVLATVETLLKLSRQDGDARWESIREKVQTKLPQLWNDVAVVARWGEDGQQQA